VAQINDNDVKLKGFIKLSEQWLEYNLILIEFEEGFIKLAALLAFV
jgi:hypothetical protein